MKLLDAAEVNTRAPGNWERGEDVDARECGTTIWLEHCDPAAGGNVIGDRDDLAQEVCPYYAETFGISASITRNSRMMNEDDASWLERVLKENSEIAVARSLLVRQGASDVWLGHEDVGSVANPGLGDPVAFGDAVNAARKLYFQRAVPPPLMHVAPGAATRLKSAGVIDVDPKSGEAYSIWGDPVVISEGYYDVDGLSNVPPVFFTAPITITMSAVNQEDTTWEARNRTNQHMLQVTRLARVETPPCAMVRVGAAPSVTPGTP